LRSLKRTLVLWFVVLGVLPLFLGQYMSFRLFDGLYRDEHALRLKALVSQWQERILNLQEQLQRLERLQVVDRLASDKDLARWRTLASEWDLDAIAWYDTKGFIQRSIQKDESGRWVEFPQASGGNFRYQLQNENIKNRLAGGERVWSFQTFPKRKLKLYYFIPFQTKKGYQGFFELAYDLTKDELKELAFRYGAEVLLWDYRGQLLLTTYSGVTLGKDFFASSQNALDQMIHFQNQEFDFVVWSTKWSWGESPFLVTALTSAWPWGEVKEQVYGILAALVIGLAAVILVMSFILTRRLVDPLAHLATAARQVLYEGKPVRFATSPFDEVTSLSEALEQLAHDVQHFRQSLENKIEELKTTQSALLQTEKMNSLGLLVAGLAHELNNPLGFVLSNFDLLRERYKKLSSDVQTDEGPRFSEELEELLASIQEGLLRIKSLVDQLKFFSSPQRTEEKQRVAWAELWRAVEVLLSHEFKTRKVTLTQNVPAGWTLYVKQREWSQVLLNVVLNALQALPADGGRIEITGRQESDWDILEVRDNGSGIPESIQDKIFQPFFTTKAPGEGSGLGLSIVYSIVKDHGGRVEVVSPVTDDEPNIATLFRFYLPRGP